MIVMKKLTLLLCFMALFGLAACGANVDVNETVDDVANTVDASVPNTFELPANTISSRRIALAMEREMSDRKDQSATENEMSTKNEAPTEIVDEDEGELEKDEPWPERVVFLTFDDGPSWNTERLLDILYTENAPSTFFALGDSILAHPNSEAIMERILAEGHYIGLHSMTHVFSTLYSGEGAAGRFVAEMRQLQVLIDEMVGHHSNLCRAPYGMISGFTSTSGHAEAIKEAGINCIDWNVDPQDWRNDTSAALVVNEIVNQVQLLEFPSELVIVLHEHDVTVEALPAIIAFLREHDYVFKAYQPGHEFTYYRYYWW